MREKTPLKRSQSGANLWADPNTIPPWEWCTMKRNMTVQPL